MNKGLKNGMLQAMKNAIKNALKDTIKDVMKKTMLNRCSCQLRVVWVMFLILFLFPMTGSAATVQFSDIRGHWAEVAINGAVQAGYVNGYPDGTFKPEVKVSHSEFMKMLVAALKLPLDGSKRFWYEQFVNASLTSGIFRYDFAGAVTDENGWAAEMTRGEVAKIVVRAIRKDMNATDNGATAGKFVYDAAKVGLIRGLDATGTLGVDDSLTRAQAVTFIERVLTVRAGGALQVDKHSVSRAEVLWHKTNIYTMWPRYFDPKDIESFSLDKAKWDSSDGIYHEEAVEYIVVDMADPNDPFRKDIEGMIFTYKVWTKNSVKSTFSEAPLDSYVSFSKFKQVVSGQYPLNLYVAAGGKLSVNVIGPKNIVSFSPDYRSDWEIFNSQQETADNILFSKDADAQPAVDWNIDRGYNPNYVKDMSVNGGIFNWIEAQVHPRKDSYSNNGMFTQLTYTPNIRYMKTYGPEKNNISISGKTNYMVGKKVFNDVSIMQKTVFMTAGLSFSDEI